MKKTWLMALMALFILGQQFLHAENGDRVNVGDTMPAFTITEDDGTTLSSDAYKGKVLLVTFFATWCPPCQKELAEYKNDLWPKYKDNPDFALLVIGREHTSADLKKYNAKKGFAFPLYPDKSRAIYNAFAENLIPRCYLVDKKGKIIYMGKGFKQEDYQQLLQHIEQALK